MPKKRNVVNEIRRATRRTFNAEEKIRIVLEGLRGEISVNELCRRESISPTLYYRWSKAFLEAGKNGLTRDTHRSANTDEVRQLKAAGDEAGLAELRGKAESVVTHPEDPVLAEEVRTWARGILGGADALAGRR